MINRDHVQRVGIALPVIQPHPASPAPRIVMDHLWAKRQAENARRNETTRRARLGLPPKDAA